MEENKNIEELRNQIAILKQKLDNQEIVSDRMLRHTMQTTVDNVINIVEIKTIACGVFAMIIFPFLHFFVGLGLVFCIFTSLMMLFCIAATLYIHHPIRKTDFMSADLATVAYEMARFKKHYNDWLHYVTPTLLIPWLIWVCYEYCKALNIDPFSEYSLYICAPLLIGGVAGGILGYSWHRKAVDSADSIIRQIEE